MQFIANLKYAIANEQADVQGPAKALVTYMGILGLHITINGTDLAGRPTTSMLSDEFGANVDISSDNKRAIKKKLGVWARRAILNNL